MNKDLQTLLRLDGLVLTHKGLELTGNPITKGGLDDLDKEIEEMRRRLPPTVVSRYGRLASKYADPLSMLCGDVCDGCERQISKRVAVLASRSHEVFECEHCGRLIFARTNAPDRVTWLADEKADSNRSALATTKTPSRRPNPHFQTGS